MGRSMWSRTRSTDIDLSQGSAARSSCFDVTRASIASEYGKSYAYRVADILGTASPWLLADVVDALGFPAFDSRYPDGAWEAYYAALDPAYPRPTGWDDRWSTMQRFLDAQTELGPYNACVTSYNAAQAALVAFLRGAVLRE